MSGVIEQVGQPVGRIAHRAAVPAGRVHRVLAGHQLGRRSGRGPPDAARPAAGPGRAEAASASGSGGSSRRSDRAGTSTWYCPPASSQPSDR